MTSVNTQQGIQLKDRNARCNANDFSNVNYIEPEIADAIKGFTRDHADFLKRTAVSGSLTQRAAAILFLKVSGMGVSQ